MAPILHASTCPQCGGGSGDCAPGTECLPSDYINPDDCPAGGCPDGEECLPDDYIDPADCPDPACVLLGDPSEIEGLTLWLDASDAGSVTLSGDEVTLWADKSGGGNDFEAGETGGPEYVAGVLNGQPVVMFNTNDEWLRCVTTLELVQPFTLFTVVMFNGTFGDVLAVVSGGVDGGGVGYHPVNGGSWKLNLGGAAFPADTFAVDAGVPYYITTQADGAGSSLARANGVAQWTGVDPGAGEASSLLHLGFRQAFGQALGNIPGSWMAEIVAYDRALDDEEIACVEDYLLRHHGSLAPVPACGDGAYIPYCIGPETADDPDDVILALAPFGYWKCDDASGNPQDSSGNGNHATAAHATITYSQAALSSKVGASIALTAGGRIHFPDIVTSKNMGDQTTAFTVVALMMFTGAGSNANGVVFITSSLVGTQVVWGLFLRDDLSSFLELVNQGVFGITNRALYPGLNVPFVLAIRGDSFNHDVWVNGTLIGNVFRPADSSDGIGWDIGQNAGDSFFGMPPMRVSNVAAWKDTALTDAQIVAISESLMDSSMMAGATVVYP